MMRISASAVLARLERFTPRGVERRSIVLLSLYTLVLFLVFLLFTYPHELQARRWVASIQKNSGWKLDAEHVTFVPWEGYRLTGVRISPPGAVEPAWIVADRLSLRPVMFELFFRSIRTFVFAARAYDGNVSGVFSTRTPTTVEIHLDELSLGSAGSLERLVKGEWAGRLSGEARLEIGADVRAVKGDGRLELSDASLENANVSGFKIPDLAFERGDAEVKIADGRAEIRKLTLAGKQVDVDVKGEAFLRVPIQQTLINLTLGIRPVPGASPDLENLLLLANRNQRPPSGAYALTLGGTVGRPRLR